MNTLPSDYEERVYAGVLGKIIGVYLGRPFEGWTNRHIEEELGEIHYYVHEKRGVPLVVSDDDISGTFTFVRALADHPGAGHKLTAGQIGKTWLNYLIEKRTILWWGGMGVSTEHTAYLRLKHGIPAPDSGSIARNGRVVAEQIGAQIFIDGWAMVCPGDPEKAVALAGRAASVSHDGEAIYGAQVIAAIEALAFVESDREHLLHEAVNYIPRASLIYELISDLREWHVENPTDWRATFRKVEEKWGYDRYGGGCHMIPNHAVILLAFLYGDDDFQKTLMIANTAGWDTDCNSGNIGCIMGIKNGLTGLMKGPDFRGPVADRMYLPTADGGRCITDAVRETYEIVNAARALQGQGPVRPNQGMRFHFNLPGALQGFCCEDSVAARGVVRIENIEARDVDDTVAADERMIAIRYEGVAPGRSARVATPTFLPPEAFKSGGYHMMASPTLYSGQTVRARVVADEGNLRPAPVCLYVRVYGKDDALEPVRAETQYLSRGESETLTWVIPDTGGRPIAEIGVEVHGSAGTGTIYLDWLGWSSAPDVTLRRPDSGGHYWLRAWVNAVDEFREGNRSEGRSYRLIQNEGTGLVAQGESTWRDYTVTALGTAHLAEAFGIIGCYRGLRRYVSLVVDRDENGDVARLVERYDDEETVLADFPMIWDLYQTLRFELTAYADGRLIGRIGGAEDSDGVLLEATIAPERAAGAVGLLTRVGHVQFGDVVVAPAVEG